MMGKRVAGGLVTLAMAGMLFACGQAPKLSVDLLDEASGVKVTAENAGADQSASSTGAIKAEDGDVLVISPCLDKGKFHLTVTSSDGKAVAYDDEVDGRILFENEIEPGSYDVQVKGIDGATGWMTVFAQDADELDAQNESLEETLTQNGIDSDTIESVTKGTKETE